MVTPRTATSSPIQRERQKAYQGACERQEMAWGDISHLSLSPLPLLALLETKARGSRRQNGSNGRTETTKEGDAVTRLTRISILSLTCAPHRGERATLSLDEGSERGGRSPRVWPPVRSDNARASITLLLRTMARAQDRCSQLHEIAVCSCSSPSSLPRVSSSFDLPSHGEGGTQRGRALSTQKTDLEEPAVQCCRSDMQPRVVGDTRFGRWRGTSVRERTKGFSARCSLRSFSKSRRGTVTHCPRSQRSPLKRNDCVMSTSKCSVKKASVGYDE